MVFKLLLLFVLMGPGGKEADISLIRKLYTESVGEKEKAEQLIGLLSAMQQTPLTRGYLGAANMVMAKHVLNPVKKLSYFRTGREYLDGSIKKSPEDAELRFLRHAIQVSAPSFLGYNQEKAADRRLLISRLRAGSMQDKQLRLSVVKFLLVQQNTTEEQQLLDRIYKNR